MSEEILVTIIDGFFTYAQMLLLLLLIGQLQDIEVSPKKRRNMMLLLIPFIVTLFLSSSWLTTDGNIRLTSRIINISLLYYTMYYYTGNLRHTFRIYALIILATLPLALLTNWIFTITNNLELVYTQLYIGIVISLEFACLLFIFTREKWYIYKEYVNRFSRKIKYLLYLYVVFEFISIIVICIKGLDAQALVHVAEYYILPIMVIFLIIIFVLIIKRLKDNAIHLETEVMTLKYYTNTVEELYSDIRYYKHDINNVLLSMKHHIVNRDIEALDKFYTEKIEGIKGVNLDLYHLIAKLELLKIDELKGLILSKYQWAKHIDVLFEIYIVDDITKVNMDVVDLCRVIGIIIDNSIEAASELDDGFVMITMELKDTNHIITVSNNYHRENRQNLFSNSRKSSKGRGRGIGLKSLVKILSKYDNASLDTKLSKYEFVQEITIKSKI